MYYYKHVRSTFKYIRETAFALLDNNRQNYRRTNKLMLIFNERFLFIIIAQICMQFSELFIEQKKCKHFSFCLVYAINKYCIFENWMHFLDKTYQISFCSSSGTTLRKYVMLICGWIEYLHFGCANFITYFTLCESLY